MVQQRARLRTIREDEKLALQFVPVTTIATLEKDFKVPALKTPSVDGT